MPPKKTPSPKKPAAKKSSVKKPSGITITAVVVDSKTKTPVPKAKVSVFPAGKKAAIDTKLTNADGKAKLTVKPGKKYRVSASKAKYCETLVETSVLAEGIEVRLGLLSEERNTVKTRINITVYHYSYNTSTEGPIAGATCTMKNLSTGAISTVVSDADGLAEFSVPVNKSYLMTDSKSGYLPYSYSSVYLDSYDNETQFDFSLTPC